MEILQKISSSRKERRSQILNLMSDLDKNETNCFNCTGVCCTSVGNSMKIDALEALDIYFYIIKKDLFSKESLLLNIKEFRLDNFITTGPRKLIRRNYTCPFYKGSSLGCSISRQSKPYGCLGFNPISQKVKDGENCKSYKNVLQVRNEINQEREEHLILTFLETYNIINDKQPISIKVLEVQSALKLKHSTEELKKLACSVLSV